MESKEFAGFRKMMKKTQREMAQLLGVSIKAIHSYEQGWRNIPTHIERQMFFLVTRHFQPSAPIPACWDIRNCPKELRDHCPAWEFNTGDLCWFINGTVCEGYVHETWKEKMTFCRKCRVLIERIPFLGDEN